MLLSEKQQYNFTIVSIESYLVIHRQPNQLRVNWWKRTSPQDAWKRDIRITRGLDFSNGYKSLHGLDAAVQKWILVWLSCVQSGNIYATHFA